MFGSTYAIFYSSASISGTMRFIILSESGHQCTLEIDNVSIAYDGTGTGVNNGKTVIQITPLNSAAYTYPDTLSITFNSSSITPTTSGDVLTYSQSSTTICTYNKSNGKVYIENDAVEDGDIEIVGSAVGRPCTITYNLDGGAAGTGSANPTSATYGAEAPILNNIPTKTGYTFGGFYTASNGKGALVYTSSGASTRMWDITTSTTLYAYWIANQYSVVFDNVVSTASGIPEITVTYGQLAPKIAVPTNGVRHFLGYYSDASYTPANRYYDETGTGVKNYDVTANLTLYARWGNFLTMSKPSDATGTIKYSSTIGGAVVNSISAVSGETEIEVIVGLNSYYVWVEPTANSGYASLYTSNSSASTCFFADLANGDSTGDIFIPIRAQFSAYSWPEIKAISQAAVYTNALGDVINTNAIAGTFSSMYKIYNFRVGDTKSTGTHDVRITDMKKGRYVYTGSSTRTNIVFETVDCIAARRMNTTSTNAGGWGGSDMYQYINDIGTYSGFISTNFSDVASLLENITVKGSVGASDSTVAPIDYTNNKLFFAAVTEIFTSNDGNASSPSGTSGEAGDCLQFEYYTTAGIGAHDTSYPDNLKYNSATDTDVGWWLRSTRKAAQNFFTISIGHNRDGGCWSEKANVATIGISPFFAF